MNQNLSDEDKMALEVVRLRKEHIARCAESSEARAETARCEREQTIALNAYNEAKKEFDAAMEAKP